MEKSNCIPKEPFIKLGTGEAPGLNYNLPQKTAFSVYGRIPTAIPASWFKENNLLEPANNWWTRIDLMSPDQIEKEVTGGLMGTFSTSGIIRNVHLLRKRQPMAKTVGAAGLAPAADARTADLVNGVQDGLMPVATPTFGGGATVTWIPKPLPQPAIYIIEEYSVASYLGEYGAGKTVSTFSLLPGEATTISVRSYEEKAETQTQSQNVLDSFTEESADEFESTLQEETGTSEDESTGYSTTSNSDVALMIDLFGIVKVGGETQAEVNNSTSSTRNTYVTATSSALEKHVTKTSSYREVEVNTTSTTTVTTGTENTISRQIENINKSRVLNFVFRQLQQEYITITFLKSVRFLYSNGYGETVEMVEIPKLETLLLDKLKPEHVEEAMALLLKSYCAVYNHHGESFAFIEKVTESLAGCEFAGEGETISYWRKRLDLIDREGSITVPGVILRVDRNILRTPALIVDAMLAGGECLDCYNQEMQEAAVVAADLENRKIGAALEILRQIADPVAKADAYQKMFYPPAEEAPAETEAS